MQKETLQIISSLAKALMTYQYDCLYRFKFEKYQDLKNDSVEFYNIFNFFSNDSGWKKLIDFPFPLGSKKVYPVVRTDSLELYVYDQEKKDYTFIYRPQIISGFLTQKKEVQPMAFCKMHCVNFCDMSSFGKDHVSIPVQYKNNSDIYETGTLIAGIDPYGCLDSCKYSLDSICTILQYVPKSTKVTLIDELYSGSELDILI